MNKRKKEKNRMFSEASPEIDGSLCVPTGCIADRQNDDIKCVRRGERESLVLPRHTREQQVSTSPNTGIFLQITMSN